MVYLFSFSDDFFHSLQQVNMASKLTYFATEIRTCTPTKRWLKKQRPIFFNENRGGEFPLGTGVLLKGPHIPKKGWRNGDGWHHLEKSALEWTHNTLIALTTKD